MPKWLIMLIANYSQSNIYEFMTSVLELHAHVVNIVERPQFGLI